MEGDDVGMAAQKSPHARTLYSAAAPVDESHLTKPRLQGGLEVRGHDRTNVLGSERMEVDVILDGEDDRAVRLVPGIVTHRSAPFAPRRARDFDGG